MSRSILSKAFLLALIMLMSLLGCVKEVVSPFKVSGITLNYSELILTEGENETLIAKIDPDSDLYRAVTWSSNNESVATVVDGKVTAVKAGKATITVTTTEGGFTAACIVTVEKAPNVDVTNIILNKQTLSLEVGSSETLTYTIAPDNATNKNVIWSSNRTNVATVDENGKVTAVGTGTANITVMTEDGEKTDSCAVMVTAATFYVTDVTLDKQALSLVTGSSETLSHTIAPDNAANKNVTWFSSSTNIATVDENGKVTAVGTGTANITVTTEDGEKTATCVVTVADTIVYATDITVNKQTLSLEVGSSETLSHTIVPDNATNKNVIWSSNRTNVATVDENGKVTAVGIGLANITVMSEDGEMTATCVITVTDATVSVTGITLNRQTLPLEVGGSETLTPNIEPGSATNKSVTWTSNRTDIATVDNNGRVTAVAVGTATITVTTADSNKTATCTVTVTAATVAVTGVTLNRQTLSLEVGSSETLSHTIAPDNATNKNVTWFSSSTNIATVDNNGRVTAISAGTAVITVSTDDGKMATCNITVNAAAVKGQFTEDFNNASSNYFNFNQYVGNGNIASSSEPGTSIISLKIDNSVAIGPGRGPEISSKDYTHFGSYSARLKIPNATSQPKVGAVVGYFTYNQENASNLSEIDFEWLIADPRIIYIGTWTGPVANPHRIGRVINLATGQIYETIYRRGGGSDTHFTGAQNTPGSITPISGYDASSQFYVYGFDWLPDRLTWWIMHPVTNQKIVLWDYSGPSLTGFNGGNGIPQNRSRYCFNFWHTNDWPVLTVPGSTERPAHVFETEVDWISFTPAP